MHTRTDVDNALVAIYEDLVSLGMPDPRARHTTACRAVRNELLTSLAGAVARVDAAIAQVGAASWKV